ncbi:hypothetical protein OAG24_00405 [bacterium]|nr:hypothetical protein [bacterium]
MECVTSRLKYNYFEVLSGMEKSMRRGNPNTDEGLKIIKDGCFFASEINHDGKSDSLWRTWIRYSDQDIGLSDPYLGLWLVNRYKLWKKFIKSNSIKPLISHKNLESAKFLMETCYVVMSSFKSRLSTSATEVAKIFNDFREEELIEAGIDEEIKKLKKNIEAGLELKSLVSASHIYGLLSLPSDMLILREIFIIISKIEGVNKKLIMGRFEMMKINNWEQVHFTSAILIAIRNPVSYPIIIPPQKTVDNLVKNLYIDFPCTIPIEPHMLDKKKNKTFEFLFDEASRLENKGNISDPYSGATRFYFIETEDKKIPHLQVYNKFRNRVQLK